MELHAHPGIERAHQVQGHARIGDEAQLVDEVILRGSRGLHLEPLGGLAEGLVQVPALDDLIDQGVVRGEGGELRPPVRCRLGPIAGVQPQLGARAGESLHERALRRG